MLGDLAELKRKNESMERELNFEMRQKALLEAKVDSLQKQLKQQLLKFNSLQEDSMNVSKDGSQQRAEIGKLKATVREINIVCVPIYYMAYSEGKKLKSKTKHNL